MSKYANDREKERLANPQRPPRLPRSPVLLSLHLPTSQPTKYFPTNPCQALGSGKELQGEGGEEDTEVTSQTSTSTLLASDHSGGQEEASVSL